MLWLAIPAPCAAQGEPGAQETAAARALFEEGVGLADQARWPEAADRFRRSLSMRPSPVVAYNLASALVHLERLVEASELLQSVSRDESAPEEARAAARALLEEVQPRLGRLTVHLDGDPTGAAVRLDDRVLPAEAVGVAIPADPGTRTVRVVRGEEVVAQADVQVAEGGAAETRIEVPPPPVPEESFRPGEVLQGEDEQETGYRPGDALRSELPPPVEPPPPEEVARAADPADVEPEPARSEPLPPEPRGSIWTNAWFWGGVGAGVLVSGAIVLALVLGGGSEQPGGIGGTLDPPLIEIGR